MSKVMELLKEKNFYLERFLEESRGERLRFKARKFENLDSLYQKREQILLNIQSIDKRISEICESENEQVMNPPKADEMSSLISMIKNNVQEIMHEDLAIISCIDNEKSKIIKEITKTKDGRKVLKGYKAL